VSSKNIDFPIHLICNGVEIMNFSEILKDIMNEKGITQTALAIKSGLRQGQISEWLSSRSTPGFYNLRIQGFGLMCSGILLLITSYPTIFYERYSIVFYLFLFGSIIPFVIGLSYFLKPGTFNEYNAYAIFGTELMMFLLGGNFLFTMFFYGVYKGFPLIINVILITIYLVLIFSLFFPDVINKYNKHDIRGKKSGYVIYLLVGFLALFFLELIMAELLGLLFS